MHRLVAALAAFAFLASASAALGAGPSYVPEGGLGVLAHDGKTRYVAVPTGNRTVIVRVSVRGGRVVEWADLAGSWGIPQLSTTRRAARGSRATAGAHRRQSFAGIAVHDSRSSTRTSCEVVDRITLQGDFAYDALSPDASRSTSSSTST